jgi:hypothetical protein
MASEFLKTKRKTGWFARGESIAVRRFAPSGRQKIA